MVSMCRYEESPDGALVRQVAPAPIPEGPSSSPNTTTGGTSWSRSHSQRLVPKSSDTPGTPWQPVHACTRLALGVRVLGSNMRAWGPGG